MTSPEELTSTILELAAEMTLNRDAAEAWFSSEPIPGWAGKTARELVREGKAQAVIDYLHAVRLGVYA